MDDDSDLIREVSVVDVYDIASEIGKECEQIIDLYGADAVTSLMPRVINALELLENLATRNERENTELQELKSKISQLENDKIEKAEYRQKFEKELEMIEEQWRCETKELLSLVAKLQEENRRLVRDTSPNHSLSSPKISSDDVLQKLKVNIEKQRDELRIKEKLLAEQSIDIDNLKSQIERLNGVSKDLRRKQKSFQFQVKNLCDERADFLVKFQEQHRYIIGLRQRLGLAQKENEDLAKCESVLPNNKAIYDLDDPNRPRFTTQELKDILNERNDLKVRLSNLEEELEQFRPKKADTLDDEDAPVQGPLPYEPDDAPWKKPTESGIRKFFRKLFSESGNGSGFPRRSLSSISKMALSTSHEPISI